MTPMIIMAIGTELGPCQACTHTMCYQMRKIAALHCWVCGKQIGMETPFIFSNCVFIHERCKDHPEEEPRRDEE